MTLNNYIQLFEIRGEVKNTSLFTQFFFHGHFELKARGVGVMDRQCVGAGSL